MRWISAPTVVRTEATDVVTGLEQVARIASGDPRRPAAWAVAGSTGCADGRSWIGSSNGCPTSRFTWWGRPDPVDEGSAARPRRRWFGEPGGIRTHDQGIKSPLLCH